ncbi:MAG: hypothetical protein NC397_09345 [Clostridium sp.]|nr:hypothetical protein [Clostridium sp.]
MQNPSSRHHYTRDELLELTHKLNKTSGEFTDIRAPKELKGKDKAEFYDLAYKLLSYGMNELDENCLADYLIARKLYLHYRQLQLDIMKTKPFRKWHCLQKLKEKFTELTDLWDLLDAIVKDVKTANARSYQQLAEKEFKICMTCANALGLTINSRAKLVFDKNEDDDAEL